jgi:hypothetical protein
MLNTQSVLFHMAWNTLSKYKRVLAWIHYKIFLPSMYWSENIVLLHRTIHILLESVGLDFRCGYSGPAKCVLYTWGALSVSVRIFRGDLKHLLKYGVQWTEYSFDYTSKRARATHVLYCVNQISIPSYLKMSHSKENENTNALFGCTEFASELNWHWNTKSTISMEYHNCCLDVHGIHL